LQLDELNIQHQHDAPLWLSESAGQVAKNLNEIVNLDLIDRVLTRLSRATRQVSSELTVCENRLLAAKSTAKELEWVEQAIADYEAVERAEAKIQEAQQEHTQLLTIVQSLEKQEEKITRLEGIVEPAQKDLDDLQETNKQWNELQDSAESLRNLLLQIGRLEGQMYEADRQGSLVDKQLKSVKTCPLCQRPIGKQ
jgi:DNA repair exonuclease SbcCD ATPase subunit